MELGTTCLGFLTGVAFLILMVLGVLVLGVLLLTWGVGVSSMVWKTPADSWAKLSSSSSLGSISAWAMGTSRTWLVSRDSSMALGVVAGGVDLLVVSVVGSYKLYYRNYTPGHGHATFRTLHFTKRKSKYF